MDEQGQMTEAQVAHMENEVAIRAANIVRAAEGLSKLVSDLKESLILNDFSSINELASSRTEELQKLLTQQKKDLSDLYASIESREENNAVLQSNTDDPAPSIDHQTNIHNISSDK